MRAGTDFSILEPPRVHSKVARSISEVRRGLLAQLVTSPFVERGRSVSPSFRLQAPFLPISTS
jgi:hypothetical protein